MAPERRWELAKGLTQDLRTEALGLGLPRLGVTGPGSSDHIEFFRAWIGRGCHGDMRYLARPDALARRWDLRGTMADVRSVVVVAQDYFQRDSPGVPDDPARGVVARYARGGDYHDRLKARLRDLLEWLRGEARARGLAQDVRGFAYVDTGPILERELGQRAGLGWFGKNTMLLHPRKGSYFFLGVLLVDLDLPPDPPFTEDHCGSCRACLEACPTGALLGRNEKGAPMMDARRCISYLTIESKGPIPRELRGGMGNRIFGCDICQEVCPWNRKFAEPSEETYYKARAGTDGPFLLEMMDLSDDEFRTRFSGSPIKRAKRRGFLRNVAVALGNWGASESAPVLGDALSDPEALVRGHAAWALGEVGACGDPGPARRRIQDALVSRMEKEADPWVLEELTLASVRTAHE